MTVYLLEYQNIFEDEYRIKKIYTKNGMEAEKNNFCNLQKEINKKRVEEKLHEVIKTINERKSLINREVELLKKQKICENKEKLRHIKKERKHLNKAIFNLKYILDDKIKYINYLKEMTETELCKQYMQENCLIFIEYNLIDGEEI